MTHGRVGCYERAWSDCIEGKVVPTYDAEKAARAHERFSAGM
ncbi:unnamed protein product [marine sediment metagenome]|uniref:Uncharacterized protein n=1 Tax=marine sediment metagenome TaxID=412755 RepID=X0YFX1_9ZZZZ